MITVILISTLVIAGIATAIGAIVFTRAVIEEQRAQREKNAKHRAK